MTKQEALEILGVSWSSLRRYVDKGLVRTSKYEMPGKRGKRNYWDEDVYAMIGRKVHRGHEVVGYIRVNGVFKEDKEKLLDQRARMRKFCNARGISLDRVYEDIAASTQFSTKKRPALHEMIQRVLSGHIDGIVIDTKDRLFRIGYEVLETMFKYHGTQLIVMNPALTDEYYQKEQSDDLAKLLAQAKIERISSH
jgi:predicted site-specific integrase-resolvase